ncbi:MAG: hypothetical protein KYX68_03395 [Flavobacterium sp.]|nr:hypothetical protein [Flavobacterium sp.]
MENQQKWHQKPVTAVLFLIFFFPVGLYLMWKNNLWSKTARIIVSVFFGLLVVGNLVNDKKSSTSNYGSTMYNGNSSCNKAGHQEFVKNRFINTGKTVTGMRIEKTYDCGYLFLVEGMDYEHGLGFDCYVTTDSSSGEIQIINSECETL